MTEKTVTWDLPAIWGFFKTLTIEPFFFLAILSCFLKNSVSGQLTQDKICMNDLNLSQAICFNVTSDGSVGYETAKDHILKTSTSYGLYSLFISSFPSLVYALFLGSWMDKFPMGRKIIMIGACLGILLDLIIDMVISILFEIPTPYILLSSVPSTLFGGVFSLFTAIYSHVVKTTAPDMMVIRFASLEVIMSISGPLATFLPGRMLTMTPWFFPDKIRNYVGVYTVTIIVLVPAIVLAYFLVNVKADQEDAKKATNEQEMTNVAGAPPGDVTETKPTEAAEQPWYSSLKNVFDLQNVKTMYVTFMKPRPDNGHHLLWLVTFGRSVSMFAGMGEHMVQYQFCQKHFNWTFTQHSDVATLFSVLKIFVPLVILPFLVKVLKMSLPVLGMLGCVLWMASLLVKGLVITEYGFYASMILHLPSSIAGTAVGTYSTTLVSPQEIGSIMAFTGVILAVMPLGASIFFTMIFQATMNSSPGLIFLLDAFFVLMFLGVLVYLYVVDKRKAKKVKK